MEKEIYCLNYNWRFTTEMGQFFDTYKVGENGCLKIEEHMPLGEGDRCYYDVSFEDRPSARVYNPNQVFYTE